MQTVWQGISALWCHVESKVTPEHQDAAEKHILLEQSIYSEAEPSLQLLHQALHGA